MRRNLSEQHASAMAYSVIFAREAEVSRDSILEYLLNTLHNRGAALHFLDSLDNALSVLSASPELYALSKDPLLAKIGYRPCLFMNYVALYKFEDDVVKVAHIFHASQDYAKLV